MEVHQSEYHIKALIVTSSVPFCSKVDARSSVANQLLKRISHLQGDTYHEEEVVVKNVAGIVYAGV